MAVKVISTFRMTDNIRVMRMVNGKKRIMRYPLYVNGQRVTATREKNLLKEAKALDEKWRQEQLAVKELKKVHGRPSKLKVYDDLSSTGVRHVRLRFVHAIKGEYESIYPSFVFQMINESGYKGKTFNIQKLGYDEAWKAAVKFCCNYKGTRVTARLLDKKPSIEQLKLLRKKMNKAGWDIPLSVVRGIK